MSYIDSLTLRNIRCFADSQPVRLGKITLLLGENSVGKSTFLCCYQAFAKLANLDDLTDYRPESQNHASSTLFNAPQYCMGNFETIARRGESSFSMIGTFADHCHNRLQIGFSAGEYGQPSETLLSIDFPNNFGDTDRLSIARIAGTPEDWEFRGTGWTLRIPQNAFSYREFSTWLSQYTRRGIMPYGGDMVQFRYRGPVKSVDEASFARLLNLLRTMPFTDEPMIVKSVAPDPPTRERYHSDYPLHDRAKNLEIFLSEAGQRLGAFSKIEVRDLPDGRRFSLYIKQLDQWLNIVDTGYGVHSMLPILQEVYDKPKDAVILLQQPEVHIHPSAQIALADFLTDSQCRYIIETHSYHFIDRFRACVGEGKMNREDLSIVHFCRDPRSGSVIPQEVLMDDDGNIVSDVGAIESFFGIWGDRDGLDFQRDLRSEWI